MSPDRTNTLLACLAATMTLASASALAQPADVDWSGVYAGGSVGGVAGVAGPQTLVERTGAYFTGADDVQILEAGSGRVTQWRPSGSLHGGYAAQFGHVVLGAEASAQTLFLDEGRTRTQEFITLPGTFFTVDQTVRADWMATLRPRVGWAQDRWLAYVTGGVALTRLQVDSTYTDTAFSGRSHTRTEETVIGWTAGGGGEYALDDSWSVRAEYLFADFGQVDAAGLVSQTSGSASDTLHREADLQTHSFLIGVSFRF